MKTIKFSFSFPADFNFKSTVYSHGWYALLPFEVEKEPLSLRRLFDLSTGKIVPAEITEQRSNNKTHLSVSSGINLSSQERNELTGHIKTCLRLDENYAEFYQEAKKQVQFRWIPALGAGRLLRSPTVFEDVVKMICTTNCSWALTEIMIENLCRKLGIEVSSTTSQNPQSSFPKPEALADCTEKFVRKEIRAGYRAPYLLELAKRIVKNEINTESWRNSSLETAELFDVVRSVKGIGPYAAGNILKLLGRYDYLAIDSWCRKRFFDKHKKGRKTSDKMIEKFYQPLGEWRGLFCWLDLTKHWYDKEVVF